jgi:hypothetical protein
MGHLLESGFFTQCHKFYFFGGRPAAVEVTTLFKKSG